MVTITGKGATPNLGETVDVFGWDDTWQWRQCLEPRRVVVREETDGSTTNWKIPYFVVMLVVEFVRLVLGE